MAPLVLKIKGNKSFSPFSNLDSEEDLSKTWRVCTKVKDSLENGSRLENLSWRLWFRQHALNEKSSGGPFQKLSKTTASQLDHHQTKLIPLKNKKKRNDNKKLTTTVLTTPEMKQTDFTQFALGSQSLISNNNNPSSLLDQQPISQPQQQPDTFPLLSSIKTERHSPLMIDNNQTMSNFTLHQFTSDQARDQIVELEDIFDAFDKGFLQQGDTAHLMVEDSNWASTATLTATATATATTTTKEMASNYQDPSYGNNSSNYCTPLSSPLESHSYHQPMQSPAETAHHHQPQQYHPHSSYNNQQSQTYHHHHHHHHHHQYQDQRSTHQQYQQQQQPYSSPVNNQPMFMSVPSSPSFLPQPLPLSNEENDSMFVSNSSPLQHPSSTGSLNMKHLGLTPQQSTQLTAYINNTLSTPPLSTSPSSSSVTTPTVTTTRIKNDEISNEDDDYSRKNIRCTTDYNSTCTPTATTSTITNNDQTYSQYQHQHVFPVSAPTTPPLHTQHQSDPFDLAPHKLNTAKLSATASTCYTGTGDGTGTNAKPICTNCSATSTPLWRRSSEDELLCNACGLYQKLHNAPRPKTLKPHNTRKETKEEEAIQLFCSNCSTTTTPLWRRDDEGAPLCNACGLYLKLHHEKRPLSMKTDIIKKRQRYETSTHANGVGGGGRKIGKKTKGEILSSTTTPSSSHSSPSHSTPPSPEVATATTTMARNMTTEKEYHMILPSSPNLPTYGYIHQHHLPSFMN